MLSYLRLHTKVRRLGYLKLLVEQYLKTDFLPINTANQYFEKIAGDLSIQKKLKDYDFFFRKDANGIIENISTGASAQPYIELAENLSIIAKNNYSYIVTKYGKVYKVILEKYKKEPNKFKFFEEKRNLQTLGFFSSDDESKNVFILNFLDKIFFLKQILVKDLLFIKSILILINDQKNYHKIDKSVKHLSLKEGLHGEILKQLDQYLKISVDINIRKKIQNLIVKFSRKQLKIRSYEDIIEPRVNWLLDLDLIDNILHKQGILKLSRSGLILLNAIKEEYDISSYIESNYIKVFSQTYQLNCKDDLGLNKKIEKYLNYSFINFKTLSPNRISASQSFTYISWMCLLRDGIVAEYKDIKDYIFTNDGKGYTIDWYPSENDGSLKKII